MMAILIIFCYFQLNYFVHVLKWGIVRNFNYRVEKESTIKTLKSFHHAVQALILFLFLANNISFCNVIKIELENNARTEIIDLSKLIDIPLLLIPTPDSIKRIGNYHFLDANHGWAVLKARNSVNLFHWDGGVWQKSKISGLTIRSPLFAINNNEIWLGVQNGIRYNNRLLHIKNNRLKFYDTPNANRIFDIQFISPTFGWAGCEWGQILQYNGSEWKLVSCPATGHIENIVSLSEEENYAFEDDPQRAILKYIDHKWRLIKEANINREANWYYIQFSKNYRDKFQNDLLGKSHLDSVYSDTLEFLDKAADIPYIWTSPNNDALRKGEIIQIKFHNKSISRCFRSSGIEQETTAKFEYRTFYFFPLKNKMRIIVFKKPRKNNKNDLFTKKEDKENNQEAGICIADFNNNLKEDRYIVVTGKANKLITMQYDPKTKNEYSHANIAEEAGVAGKAFTRAGRKNYDVGATCADIDNDGDQDIIVTSLYGPNEVFKQIKKLQFRESAKTLHLYSDFSRSQSGIWGDVNNDGYIDLFVSNEDSSNHLYLNNGAGIFKDVTDDAGLLMQRGGTGSVFGDIDNDGDLDLFVPRYGAGNKLFRNDCSRSNKKEIKFTDITNKSGVAGRDTLSRSVHGLLADFDNDGDLDLLVANSGMENWLFLNDGSGTFHDVTDSAGFSADKETNVACYFDADNDGDLDLLVCNRNRDKYYENQGNASFIDKSPPSFLHKGGYPMGIAAADFNNDGDIDLYCSDDFKPSHSLRNNTDNNNFIKIKVSCSKSNRDGIGSKLYLFQHGHLGEKAYLLAMRHITAGGPRNSMSSQVVHFGIADSKPKDILINFPSGIQRKLVNIQPGRYLQIKEQDGIARKLALLQKWYIRTVRYTPNQNEALYILSYIFIFIVGLFFLFRTHWKNYKLYLVLWIPLGLFLIFYLALKDSGAFSHYFLPILFSVGSLLAGIMVNNKINVSPTDLMEYQEKLFFATNAFFHGGWGARKLNRLKLYCANLSAEEIPAKKIQFSLLESIDDYFSLVLTEIERILIFARTTNTLPSTISACRTYLFTLSTSLNALKTELNLNKKLTGTLFNAIIENIQLLQANLRLMRKTVSKQFTCDIKSETKRALENFSIAAIDMELAAAPNAHLIARIRPAEYSQILENLIKNAIRATKNKNKKKVIIKINANLDFVFISVEDNGCGIEPAIQEKLFQEQFSTKNKSGGFGLYNSQIILKKYGGKISLLKTILNQGSILELQLKRIDNDW